MNKYNEEITYDTLGYDLRFVDQCAVIVSVHYDDEWFEFASFLMNYKRTIYLFVTHSTDTISKEKWLKQTEMFKQSITELNQYRKDKGFEEVIPIVFNCANFNGMTSESRAYIHNIIEDVLWQVKKIDYYVASVKSTHQSHTESNNIAISMMRSPYIEKCKTILLGTYTQAVYGLQYSDEFRNINTYVPMTEDQVDFACRMIGDIYGEKNLPNSILGSGHFKEMLKFYGNCIAEDYAQPYINLRHKITLND